MQTPVSITTSETLSRDVTDAPNAPVETRPSKSEARLQDLIPIVMVIVGGCEPCAEKTVKGRYNKAVRGRTSTRL